MERNELLRQPYFWFTKIQIALYNCAEKFMTDTNKNRKELAEYLGVSKGYISQLLSGDYNYSLEKLVDLSIKLGYIPQIEFCPIEQVLEEDKQVYSNKIILSNLWDSVNNKTETIELPAA